jgi:hypothetical protein
MLVRWSPEQLLASMMRQWPARPHPILVRLAGVFELGELVTNSGLAERLIIERGRPFVGIKGHCLHLQRDSSANAFLNASRASLRGKGLYVEGFALRPGQKSLVQHAWIAVDQMHAVEVTWREEANACEYFGIVIPRELQLKHLKLLGKPILENCDNAVLETYRPNTVGRHMDPVDGVPAISA